MANQNALMYAQEMAKKTHELYSDGRILAWSGTSGKEAQLLTLRQASAELVAAIGGDQSGETILKKYGEVVAQIDAAGLTGLLTENELGEYYILADKLWAAIEKENK